jgi:hypothetical protein
MAEEQPGEIDPVYLTLEDILELHGLIVGVSPTEAADQLRNRDGLENALARPATTAITSALTSRSRLPCLLTASPRVSSSLTGTSEPPWSPCSRSWRSMVCASTHPTPADWILSFSSGATPEDVANLIRSTVRGIA